MGNLLNMSGSSLLKKGLPYDAEIEYLESTGTQWIDTGLDVSSLDYSISSYGDIYFGFVHNNNGSGTFIIAMTSQSNLNNIWYEYYRYKDRHYYTTITPNTKITYDMNNGLYINDGLVVGFKTKLGSDDISGLTMPICGRYDFANGKVGSTGSRQNRQYTISQNGVVIFDFIPVRVGQVGYMYDKVSGQLFGNAGTGNFILGPDKTN